MINFPVSVSLQRQKQISLSISRYCLLAWLIAGIVYHITIRRRQAGQDGVALVYNERINNRHSIILIIIRFCNQPANGTSSIPIVTGRRTSGFKTKGFTDRHLTTGYKRSASTKATIMRGKNKMCDNKDILVQTLNETQYVMQCFFHSNASLRSPWQCARARAVVGSCLRARSCVGNQSPTHWGADKSVNSFEFLNPTLFSSSLAFPHTYTRSRCLTRSPKQPRI